MALKEWKNERSFTSCEDCGSWGENGCRMDLQPVRAGFNAAGDFYDCKNFHLAPKKEVKEVEPEKEKPAPAAEPAAEKKEAEAPASVPAENEQEIETVEGEPAAEKEAPKKEAKAKAKKTSKKK